MLSSSSFVVVENMHIAQNDANGTGGGKLPIVLKKVKSLMECVYQGQVEGLVLFCFSVPKWLAPSFVVRGTNKRLFDLLRYPREIRGTGLWKNIQASGCKGVLSTNVCRILVGNAGYDLETSLTSS